MTTEEKIADIIVKLRKKPEETNVSIDESFDNLYTPDSIIFGMWHKNFQGKYFKKDDNGVPQLMQVPNDMRSCFGLDIDDKTTCSGYMKTLVNKNEEFGKEMLKAILTDENSDMYFKNISNKINDLHPKIALLILRRFGFQIDTDKKQILPVSYWLSELAKKYFINNPRDDFDFDSYIKNKEGLLKFLNLLVHYINANPGILDKNYVASADDLANYVKSVLDQDGFKTDQQPYFVWIKGNVESVYPIATGGSRKKPINKNLLRHLIRNADVFNSIDNSNSQYGGNYPYTYETNITKMLQQNTSERLVNYYNYVKQIAAEKKIAINAEYMLDLIDKIKIYEKKILDTLAVIQKFTENNKSFGSDKAISLVMMEDYLDDLVKYSQNNQELESKIIQGINNIANKINNERAISRPIDYNDMN